MSDLDANTLYYYEKNNNKFYYIIDKHFYNDKSIESQLYWIPPIHPVLLISIYGEVWHARTKISTQLKKTPLSNVKGIHSYEGSNLDIIPDYLISDYTCNDMNKFYSEYRNRDIIINKEFRKYLKYKNKYIELKNKINNKL